MKLRRLLLKDFRNYTHLDLEPAPGLNLLVGANAQGKTNLLESILFLAVFRSPRAAREAELIRWGAAEAHAAAVLARGEATGRLEVRLRQDRPKAILWNGAVLRPQEALGILTAVSFFPDDLELVKGAPAGRRRLLDVLLCQADGRYRRHLARLLRVLRHRNVQLKALQGQRHGAALLDVFNEQLLNEAVPILVRRAQAVRRLGEWAAAIHGRITGQRERLELVYRPFFAGEGEGPDPGWEEAGAVRERFAEVLRRRQGEELARGVSLVGPQRDDVQFLIDGADARTFASQGQQRTAVLACKLAELEFLRTETGAYPVLLLDDVLSELDGSRRAYLLEAVGETVQTFVTAAHLDPLPGDLRRRAQVFHVERGSAAPAA
ncbi:MAG: DNA replication/repair protein RecF [Limnochordales bacterium]|nr:DNA replication/repair protein RecF [Limnochordales bacterium]